MDLTGIDHLVLTVSDIDTTCAFYEQLGADRVTFGGGRTALHFGQQKINLHPDSVEHELIAANPTPGSGDICLRTDTPISAVETQLQNHDIDIIAGPVERAGAMGPVDSIYIRDPDENLVEIANYQDEYSEFD